MCNKLSDKAHVFLLGCLSGKNLDSNPALRILAACDKVESVTTCRGCTEYSKNGKAYCPDGLRRFYRGGKVFEGPATVRNDDNENGIIEKGESVTEPGFHWHDALSIGSDE